MVTSCCPVQPFVSSTSIEYTFARRFTAFVEFSNFRGSKPTQSTV